jgi:Uncharacterized protein conserved in bacteria
MNSQNDEELLRKDYLLGQLSDQMREQVEERLLDDDDFVERLSTTEDDLIDDYVFGALSESERRSFEDNFVINDERRRKVQFAQSVDLYLDKLADPQPSPVTPVHSSPWWTTPLQLLQSYIFWIAVPVFALLLVFVGPKIVRWIKPSDPVAVVQTNRALIEHQIEEFNKLSTGHNLASYELALDATPILRDKGGIKRVTLAPNTGFLDLKLAVLSPPRQKYRALVSTVEGVEQFAVALERDNNSGPGSVLFKIPTQFLNTGDYQIQLSGVGPDGQLDNPVRYYFGVIKHF